MKNQHNISHKKPFSKRKDTAENPKQYTPEIMGEIIDKFIKENYKPLKKIGKVSVPKSRLLDDMGKSSPARKLPRMRRSKG
jgi:hypothetical protein